MSASGQGAVKVEVTDSVTHPPPKMAAFRRTSASMPDAHKILQAHLPTKEQFREALKELQDLEGPWEYYWPGGPDSFTLCSPTFNADGDLLFELRRSSHTTSRQQRQFQSASAKMYGFANSTATTGMATGGPVGQNGQSSRASV